jgi:hypothetical protein
MQLLPHGMQKLLQMTREELCHEPKEPLPKEEPHRSSAQTGKEPPPTRLAQNKRHKNPLQQQTKESQSAPASTLSLQATLFRLPVAAEGRFERYFANSTNAQQPEGQVPLAVRIPSLHAVRLRQPLPFDPFAEPNLHFRRQILHLHAPYDHASPRRGGLWRLA